MLKPTKLHEDVIDAKKKRYTVKIGSCVPKNAVNLAYYYNKKANADQSLLVSESAKNIIDHKFVERWITKGPLETKNETVFPWNIFYHDNDGYSGILYRRFINWETTTHVEKKTCKAQRTKTGLMTDFSEPIDREYFQDGLYGGLEYLMNVDYTVTSHKDVTMPWVKYKECTSEKSVTQSSNSASFPDTVNYNRDGFSGTLHKNGSPKVDKIFSSTGSSAGSATTTETYYGPPNASNNYPPKSKMIGGTLYTLKTATYGKTKVEKWLNAGTSEPANGSTATVTDPTTGETITFTYTSGSGNYGKHQIGEPVQYHSYGLSWYNGSGSRYGFSGTAEQGNWSDAFPYPMADYYGRVAGETQVDSAFHYDPQDGKGKVETSIVLSDGSMEYYQSAYEYDIDESRRYQSGSGNRGMMWLKQYVAAGGNIPPTNGRDSSYWDNNVDNRYPSAYDSSLQGSTRGDVIGFYKWTTTAYRYQAKYTGESYATVATYEAQTSGVTTPSYKITQRYNNVLLKDDSKVIKMPSEYSAKIDYKGVLQYTWYDYTGAAFYDGSVIKRGAIDNVNPVGSNLITMYPDDSGVLHNEYGKKELASENMEITDLYKDGVPLFYKYKLKYKVFDSLGPNSLGICTGNYIKLVNTGMMTLNMKKYKHLVKLVPADPTGTRPECKDLYEAYIYTSFPVTSNFKVLCSYNAYDDSPGLSTLDRLKPGFIEALHPQPFFEKGKDYTLTVADAIARKNIITLTKTNIITDTRNKIPLSFRVKTSDGSFASKTMYAEAINIDYAFDSEKPLFNGRNYNISPIQDGNHMNACEIIMRDCKSQLVDIHGNYDTNAVNNMKSKIFVVEFVRVNSAVDNNRKLVNLYTPQDGNGVVSVETTADTGFADDIGGFTRVASLPGKYKIVGNKIYPAYEIMCKDAKLITVRPPNSIETLENWYPRVAFSHFERVYTIHGMAVKLNYSMPEYDTQEYSSVYGKPYMDVVNEKAIVINERVIKIKNSPLYVKLDANCKPTNLTVIKKDITGTDRTLKISNWIYTEGLIELEDIISENDTIFVTYTYEEQHYVYRGFYGKGSTFIDLDVNPSKYHTFLDNRYEPYERRHVYDLYNTVIYFFLRPSRISQIYQDGWENITPPVTMIPVMTNTKTIYHKFGDSMPDSKYDIAIGNIHIRQGTSLKSTVVIDTRTRGGGVIEAMSDQLRRELEPESDYYWDIGYWDGEPYTENAVIVIRLDRRILKTFGGRFTPQEVDKAVSKWITAGVMPIIEYVTTFTKEELPQASLTISYEHTNKLEYTPTMFISTVEV